MRIFYTLIYFFSFFAIEAKSAEDSSRKYVITGGPGVGKTTLIRHLEDLGFYVVHEAATDLIKEELAKNVEAPWMRKDFSERVALLQRQRQKEVHHFQQVFFDRSPIDALTYDILKNSKPSDTIVRIVEEAVIEKFYNKKVFLIEDLGVCLQTEVRAETLEEARNIEQLLEKNYLTLGFKIIRIPAGSIEERIQKILSEVEP